MRSVGLGTLVVAVIFAAAFGVYFWLIGDPEPKVQVAEPATQQTSGAEPQETASSEQESTTTSATSAAQDNTQNATGQSSESASSVQQSAASQSAAQPQQKEQTTAATPLDSGSKQPQTPAAADSAPNNSAAERSAAPVEEKPAQPKAPQVVARSDATSQVTSPEAPAKAPAGAVPSFDVVRVEKTGEAILAGRAPAGSEVTIYDGDIPLGIVKADSRGQWVLILDIPLQPGSHSLGITARQEDDTLVESAELVIVAVPEPRLPEPQTQVLAEAQSDEASAGVPSDGVDTSSAGREAVAQAAEAIAGDTQVAVVTESTEDPAGTPQVEPVAGAADSNADAASESEDGSESPVAPSQVAAADAGIDEPIAVIVPRHGSGPTRILQQPELLEDGIGNGSLFLDSVDYDDEGRAVIGGRAAPGASLIIYLDNLPIGEALSDDGGRWVMTPDDLVPVGLHQLRVDQIERGGRVLARVETPFSRADTVESHPDENFVTVQPGNSLWRIARAAYGRGTRYTVIYESNKTQIRDPDLIYPGQIFRLPSDG